MYPKIDERQVPMAIRDHEPHLLTDTLKGQVNLEQHDGRTIVGVGVRTAQRIPALTAAGWHDRATGQPVTRSLTAYDC
ncbi:hypothetical protein AB0H12_34750 [Actinosynnema sp. NPDC023794]